MNSLLSLLKRKKYMQKQNLLIIFTLSSFFLSSIAALQPPTPRKQDDSTYKKTGQNAPGEKTKNPQCTQKEIAKALEQKQEFWARQANLLDKHNQAGTLSFLYKGTEPQDIVQLVLAFIDGILGCNNKTASQDSSQKSIVRLTCREGNTRGDYTETYPYFLYMQPQDRPHLWRFFIHVH